MIGIKFSRKKEKIEHGFEKWRKNEENVLNKYVIILKRFMISRVTILLLSFTTTTWIVIGIVIIY